MRAQENNLVGGLTSTTTSAVVNNTNNNEKVNANNISCTTTSCPNKGKIQTLRQRKTELEKLLEEKNLLLQQIQRQEAQIIGNEWLTTSSSSLSATSIDISSAGNNNKDDQVIGGQQNTSSSTLRRKVGSSFKLPRIVKKEHQTDIENLLLEKKLQQEICNTSYKLANDLTLNKSVRGSQKAEYEAAQQKLNVINQNLNVLKKRQLRSHSTSFSENLLTQNNNNNGSNGNIDNNINHNNANTINNGNVSSLNLKSSPLLLTSSLASPQPSYSQSASTILSTNLRNNTNYNLNSGDCTLLIPSKRTNNTLSGTTTTNTYITNKINNNNNSNSIKNNKSMSNNNISTISSNNNSKNNVNNYLSSDRRNSIKSAILNSSSKHNSTSSSSSSTGLVQHFDRTLKNHRSDYDINRIMPSQQIDKYQFNEEFCTNINRLNDSYSVDNSSGDADELSNGDLNYSNNYCNTFPIQLQYQRNHYNAIDCNLSSTSAQNILKQQPQHYHQQQQQAQGQNQHHPQYITTAENYNDNYYNRGPIYDNSEFEVINNRNRVSENFEKSSTANTKDGRYFVGVQQSLQNNATSYDNDDSNIIFYSRNSNTIYSTNSDHNITQTCGNDWKQNKVYNDSSSFDAVSYFQSVNNQSTNSLNNAAQQQQQQTGLGGFWKILPNNERIWYSTTDDNDDQKTISSIQQQKNKLQQQIQNSYLSDDVSSIITPTTKDENNSDKISISSINSETNKKSREKQWLETLLDTPIIQPKPLTLMNNQQDSGMTTIQQQQQPRPVSHQYLYHYHHHDANNIYPSTPMVQYNVNTIPNTFYPVNNKVHNNGYKERSKLSSQSMSNKTYQRSAIQQRLEDQSRLSHSTSVLNKQFTDHQHYHHQQQQQKQLENQSHNSNNNKNTSMNSSENIILNYHNNESGNETDKLQHQKQQHQQQQHHHHQQQQSQSNYHSSFNQSSPSQHHHHHHHHYHMLRLPTNNNSRITNNIDDNMIPSSESLSYITASASSPSPIASSSLNTTTTVASTLTSSSNNFYNKTALITNAINKAHDIRVESPKNMTVIQKAVFVPYKEVTKPFEMSDFYKYSTKFRQKDNQQQQQQQQLITNINNSNTNNTSKQSQQQQSQQEQYDIGTINTNTNNNNNNVNNYETRNTTTTVVEKVK